MVEASDTRAQDQRAAHRAWLAGAIALGVVSAVSVPFAVYVFIVPGHLGLPLDGKVAWLGGLPVWGMVECARKARTTRAAHLSGATRGS